MSESTCGYFRWSFLWLLAISSGTAGAAPPDAGALLESVKPAPGLPQRSADFLPEAPARPALKLDAGIEIPVQTIRIVGNHIFTDAELHVLVADAIGRKTTLAELDAVAQRITRHYRDAGYLLARAYLPAQEIRDDAVEIAVLEGRLGELRIENASALADDRVRACLAQIEEGAPLVADKLERGLLLLNDLPGVEARSTLKPGASVGSADLDIRVDSRAPYTGSVEADNYGNRFTGDLRLGGSFSAGNLADLGDTLAVRALSSQGMEYGRLAWQFPVGDDGTQVGAAYSNMRYRLGKDFANLRAHGAAGIGSVYLLHPFVRSRNANLNGQIAFDRKRLADDVDSTATRTRKALDVLTLGFSGDRVDGLGGGGMTNGSLAWSGGRLALDTDSRVLDAAGHRTAGRFGKLSLNVARLQRLTDDANLHVGLQAQAAGTRNLDSSEKLTLGGAQAVRAYPQGEASADDAWLANVELRYRFLPGWQASLFYDAAGGRLNHRPIIADGDSNVRRLSGYGLGLAWTLPAGVSLQMAIAWRDGPRPTADNDRSPRAWIQAVAHF